jgi:hypothetical protein
LFKDLFEQITIFGNRVVGASYHERTDGKFEVDLEIECRKFVADQEGNEHEVPMDEWIEIGAFAKPERGKRYGATLHRQRVRATGGNSSYHFVVDRVPDSVGVDPFSLLIDRVPADNLKRPSRVESD